jgi:glycosyltransferase involved in cell wall biosynthesis
VVVLHPLEMELKGTAVALAAVRHLRQQGHDCRLVRVTQWPVSDAERAELLLGDLHVNVKPRKVAGVMRRSDLLLAPSSAVEGFGLPVLEAAASGLPVVASDIPAFRGLLGDWPALVPFDDPAAFVECARRVLTDRAMWRALRARGLEIARAYSAKEVAGRLEEALRWVADGAWKRDDSPPRVAAGPEVKRA